MLARVLSAAVNGIEAFPVEVEVKRRIREASPKPPISKPRLKN
jgi:hypothetical protein